MRQSALALVGDLAISAPHLLEPYFSVIMPDIVSQITPDIELQNVSNNAIWACGEISCHLGVKIEPWASIILPRLLEILFKDNLAVALRENAAMTIGRLGLAAPEVLAPSLDDFASKFCIILRGARGNDEKDTAFQGFCHIVQRNPNGLIKHIANFTLTIAKYEDPSPQLMDMFKKVMHCIKNKC